MLLYFSSSWAALPRWRLSWRLPGCPPRFRPPPPPLLPCPPRPRRRPPCLLLIKCLRPYAVKLAPLPSSGRAARGAALTLSSRSALQARDERPIASGVERSAPSFREGGGHRSCH